MIEKTFFGKTKDGKDVYAVTLTSKIKKISATVLTYGATLNKLCVPDKNGVFADVICGYDTVEGYELNGGYQGATIGRYGNRIQNSSFSIDGKTYVLYNNEKKNHLHGGKVGFDKKIWDVSTYENGSDSCAKFSLISADMEEGYPGKLTVFVTFTVNDDGISIHYQASTDKKTVVNLTNHSYFNLGGYQSGTIENHLLWIDSDYITPTDEELIPTGELLSVQNTPFDFRKEKKIGQNINNENQNLSYGKGYDHNFVINDSSNVVKHIATLKDPTSGRIMKVLTDQPCVQIYTANCINENDGAFKNNVAQKKRCAVAIETQHAPNTPNQKKFGSCELAPGDLYDTTTSYFFEN